MLLKETTIFTQEIKKSRFICVLERVQSADEIKPAITQLKKDYPQASHYCYAAKIGAFTRSSDDGEPSGTAGRPMLDVLNGSDADQILAVVIRYFGGTLLGKGGLVRAYSSSVAQALQEADFMEEKTLLLCEARVDYALAGKVEACLRSLPISDLQDAYGNEAVYTFCALEDYSDLLQERFSGQVQFQILGTKISEG